MASVLLLLAALAVLATSDRPSHPGETGKLYGAQYWTSIHQYTDVLCALCHTSHSATFMVPVLQYHGYLTSGQDNHAAQTEFVCLDSQPEDRTASARDDYCGCAHEYVMTREQLTHEVEKLSEAGIKISVKMDLLTDENNKLTEKVAKVTADNEMLADQVDRLEEEKGKLAMQVQNLTHQNTGVAGSTFVRWGRTRCPDEATIIYTGYGGGSSFTSTGSGANSLCLSAEPVFDGKSHPTDTGKLYGIEYYISNHLYTDVVCVLCYTSFSATFMVPGTNRSDDPTPLEAAVAQQAQELSALKAENSAMKAELAAMRTELNAKISNVQSSQGSTFVRWGRTVCPPGSDIIHTGYAGGAGYTNSGSGANRVCLTDKPVFDDHTMLSGGHGNLHGAQYWVQGHQRTDVFSDKAVSGTGFKMFYSIHPANQQPERLTSGLFNCSVPYFHTFQLHFSCNLATDCVEGEDEMDCPYKSYVCGPHLIDAGSKCLQYIEVGREITCQNFSAKSFPDLRYLDASGAWAMGFILAVIPLLPMTSGWEFYSQTGICIPLPVTRQTIGGHDYAFRVMVALNLVLFVLIAVGQLLIFCSRFEVYIVQNVDYGIRAETSVRRT
nr:hypothetical protein BaRGS_016779 [Batillaria attramentaria]